MRFIRKYWQFFVSFLALVFFVSYYLKLVSPNHTQALNTFQKEFSAYETRSKKILDSVCFFIEHEQFSRIKRYVESQKTIDVHIFTNDSLIYWNTNKTPISRFVDIQFPSDGLLKLQNGWYYAKAQKVLGKIVSCSFLIKNEFLVENEYLNNNFNSIFSFPFKATILLDKAIAFPIYSEYHKYLFSIQTDQEIVFSDMESNVLMFSWLLFMLFALLGVLESLSTMKALRRGILVGSVSLVYVFLIYLVSNNISYIRFVDPILFAFSFVVPNFFTLISHVLFSLFLVLFLKRITANSDNLIFKNRLKFVLLTINFFLAYLLILLTNSIVKDSSIPLEINKLFQLNVYTFWTIVTIGLLVLAYLVFVRLCALLIFETLYQKASLVLLFLINMLFLFYAVQYFETNCLIAAFPLLLFVLAVFQIYKKDKLSFKYTLTFLFFASLLVSQLINEAYLKKENAERKLYADQLATEQDISTEVNFDLIEKEIATHPFFQKVFDKSKIIRSKELKDFMDKTFYKDFWERYEVDYILYNPKVKKTITSMSAYDLTREDIYTIITNHSIPSEINSHLYYVKDYVSQLSYISKVNIESEDKRESLTLFAVYKSKRIPEKIGFPKLLISQNANVLKVLENYTLAKYYHRKLVSQNGDFSYPSTYKTLLQNYNKETGYYNYGAYDHLMIRKNDNDVIVLSKKEYTIFQQLTSFSYLCCFYGVFVFFFVSIKNWSNLKTLALSFATKIQFTLVGVVLISLIAFGFGSGIFVKKQYDEYANKLIKEKMQSIQSELIAKTSSRQQLSMEFDGEELTNVLSKLAAVFSTDINMYDQSGYLIATSRQKLFNLGLISEQLNPTAFKELRKISKSDLIQNENIGKLNYLSAYFPLYNKQNNLICYVNLQYFDQQQGYVNQIEKFLVSIINIFILLLILSILIAVIVSNWLTSPLRILQESLSNVQMGKYNEPLPYASNDEIGALVKNYNQKLNELAIAANQLAQSEREFAWREMAKQVAHEIKNPLTPMKLSLQHLQRIYDPTDPLSNEKLNKVIVSLIEQIDTLTQIANEFSNFAKLPKENLETMDLIPILSNVVLIYQGEHHINIQFSSTQEQAFVKGDKNLLLQVFNNLITNAIQAISYAEVDGFININVSVNEDCFLISFEDNGLGISDDIKHKMFEPNFTTKSTGSGLGLALSKQIIEAHNGSIWFESEKNNTTKFFIKLPKI